MIDARQRRRAAAARVHQGFTVPGHHALMEKVAKAKLQILVAEPSAYLASLTSSLLRSVGIKKITEVDNARAAQIALERTRFDALIIDSELAPLDGVALTRAVRTDPHNLNRDTTIVLVFSEISRAQLIEARDAGVTEFIRKPLSAAVLDLRLKATWTNPRPFVTAPAYAGPDRRRRAAGVKGPNRRKSPQPAV